MRNLRTFCLPLAGVNEVRSSLLRKSLKPLVGVNTTPTTYHLPTTWRKAGAVLG